MHIFSFLLQTGQVVQAIPKENYFDILLKGGVILIPIALLSVLSIYIFTERFIYIKRSYTVRKGWIEKVISLTRSGQLEEAAEVALRPRQATGYVIAAALKKAEAPLEEIQETIEVESRQQISNLEFQMNYLGITASIAPMLGFLGTIFGVIKIFYSISATEDLSIGTISAGLYQKMILSACGLLVGIVAFAGYHFLNGWIDRIVIRMDRECHDFLDAMRDYKAKK